jgi:hypothetical protein
VSLSEWRRWHPGRCQACGTVLTGEETSEAPSLCDDCFDRIDIDTERLLEEQHPWGLT